MTMSEPQGPEVVKWYTRARKFPQLIGRTPDGAKIWGGPYTITQAIGLGLTLLVGANTMSLWGGSGVVGNAFILWIAAVGVVIVLGRLPVGARNPIAVVAGAVRALTAPQYGRLGGKPVRLRRPHQVRHRVVVLIQEPDTTQPAPAASAPKEQLGAVEPPRRTTRWPVRVDPSSAGPYRVDPSTAQRHPVPAARPPVRSAARPVSEPAARKPALTGVQMLLAGGQADTRTTQTTGPTNGPATRSETA
jgi:hypothetical protein